MDSQTQTTSVPSSQSSSNRKAKFIAVIAIVVIALVWIMKSDLIKKPTLEEERAMTLNQVAEDSQKVAATIPDETKNSVLQQIVKESTVVVQKDKKGKTIPSTTLTDAEKAAVLDQISGSQPAQ